MVRTAFHNWLFDLKIQNAFQWQRSCPSKQIRVPSARRQGRNDTPQTIDVLEARQMLTTITWNVDTDGFWDDPANWLSDTNQQRVPNSGDTVIINRASANPTIIVRDNQQIGSLSSSEAITVTGGTLRIDGGGTQSALLTVNGGNVEAEGGAPLALTGNTSFVSGSFFGGGTFSNQSIFTVSGAADKGLATNFTNTATGTIRQSGTGTILFGGTLNNLLGGVFDFRSDGDLVGSGTINNSGTFQKTVGAGVSRVAPSVGNDLNFNHLLGSTVDAQIGTLQFDGDRGESTGATWKASAGATVAIVGHGFAHYAGAYGGTGAGNVQISGTMNFNPGTTLNFADNLFQWVSGAFGTGNEGIINNGSISITTANDKALFGRLLDNGVIEHKGTGRLLISGSTILEVAPGGLYDFQADGGISHSDQGAGFGPYIKMQGTMRKSAGTGTSLIDGSASNHFDFNLESGTLDVQTGHLNIAEGGAWQGGTINVSSGAVMDLTGDRGLAMVGTFSGTGAGQIRSAIASLGSYDFGVGGAHATLNFPQGLFHLQGGVISSGGSASGIGSATTLVNTGFMTIDGAAAKGISASGLINQGTIINNGTGLFGLNGSTLTNADGAVFEQHGDSPLSGTDQFGNSGRFINAGLFAKTAGAGTVDFNVQLENQATGVIEVDQGKMRFSRGGSSTGGTFDVSAGATLELGGTDLFRWSGNYTGTGPGHLDVNSLLAGPDDAAHPGILNFPDGMFRVIGGQLLGALTNEGFVTFAPTTGLFTRALIVNNGTWNFTGAGDFVLNANSRFVNNGLFDIKTDADLVVPGDASGGSMYFINSPMGIFRKSAGTGITELRHDGSFKELRFDNTGSVEALSGTIQFDDPVNQFSGTTLMDGSWTAGPFSTIAAPNASNFTTNKGDVILNGTNSAFANINALNNNLGSFSLLGGRDFTTVGNLSNSGKLFASAGSILTVNGTLTESVVKNLVGYWKGDYSENDSAGTNDGFLQGNATYDDGKFGPGFVLDGDGDYVKLANSPPLQLQDFTISAWVKRASTTKGGLIFGYGQSGYTFGINDDGTLLLSAVGISSVSSTNLKITDTGFHHVAITKSGASVIVYVDGVAETLAPYQTFFSFFTNPAIGARADNGTGSFNGVLDEVAIFNRPLGPTEIQSLMTDNDPKAVGNLLPLIDIAVNNRPSTNLFGKIVTTGAATLTGELKIDTLPGFAPPAGDVYQVLTYPSHVGSFTKLTGIANTYLVDVQAAKTILTSIAAPPLDLIVNTISAAPPTGHPGDNVTVTYTVKNQANQASATSWVDSIYLSKDEFYSPDDLLFSRVTHAGGVAALGTYTGSATAQIPGVLDGNYHFVVVANSRGLLFESNRTNNTKGSTGTVAVSVPTLTLGTQFNGVIKDGQDLYYRVDVPTTGDLLLTANFAVTQEAELYVKRGSLPTRGSFDDTASNLLLLHRELLLESPQPGPVYILLHGRSGASTGKTFNLKVESDLFDLRSFTPVQGANVGPVTVTLNGAGFTKDAVVTLINSSNQVAATATITLESANRMYAKFNLTGLAVGKYDIKITEAAGTKTINDGFEITTGIPGRLQTTVLMPGRVRGGSTFTGYIDYENIGGTDLTAPLIFVYSPSQSYFQIPSLGGPFQNYAMFLATSKEGLPGVLRPGEKIRVPFQMQATADFNSIETSISYADSTAPFDWEEIRNLLLPTSGNFPNFDTVFNAMKASVGTTVGKYVQMLARNATLLPSSVGNPIDPLDLVRLELHRFEAAANTSITGKVDITNFQADTRGVKIVAQNLDTHRSFATTSLMDGSFIFDQVTPGHYEFRVAGSTVISPASGVTVVAANQHLTNVLVKVQDAYYASGLVVDENGDIVPFATVVAYKGSTIVASAVSDTKGNYSLSDLAPGTYDFVTIADGYSRAWQQNIVISSDITGLNQTVGKESTIKAHVTVNGAAPDSDSFFIFATIQGSLPIALFAGDDDGAGNVLLESLSAGTYDISFISGDVVKKLTSIVVGNGTQIDLGDIELVPPAPITQAAVIPVTPQSIDPIPLDLEVELAAAERYTQEVWINLCSSTFGYETAGIWQTYLDSSVANHVSRLVFTDVDDIVAGGVIYSGFKDSGVIPSVLGVNLEDIRDHAISYVKSQLEQEAIDCDHLHTPGGFTIDLKDIPSVAQKLNLNVSFNRIWEIPGNLAGGMGPAVGPAHEGYPGTGQEFPDLRYLTGSVSVQPMGEDTAKITFSVKFHVDDTVDFIRGDEGTLLEKPFTKPMKFLEWWGRAYDVPFTASWYMGTNTYFKDATITFRDPKPPEDDCDDPDPPKPPGEDGGKGGSENQKSNDPNEKDTVGAPDPNGDPNKRFVLGDTELAYTVRFENVPTATAPAQQVVITDVLDPKLDLNTFQLGEFHFGDFTVAVPAGLTAYQTQVDATATLGMYVNFEASLDFNTRTVTWKLTSIDPATGDSNQSDPDFGFLPPNDEAGHGAGYVTYSILPLSGLADDTAITNNANIVFDFNAPIITNTTTNVIDLMTPTSSVNALPTFSPAKIHVSWTGDDGAIGSGAAYFDVYVSTDGGAFVPFLIGTSDTSADFTGVQGHTYGFYSVATDGVGHKQAKPTAAQATTRVNTAPTLNANGSPTFTSINEDDTANTGTSIADLIARMGPNGSITDPDPGAQKGIAVIGLDQSHGFWQYSTNNGTNWSSFGFVSADFARLLASSATTRIRFVPQTNYNGPATLTYIAWDQSAGTNGGSTSTASRGADTAFSTVQETASITVLPVNDAPVLDASGDPTLPTRTKKDQTNPGMLISDFINSIAPKNMISDVDLNPKEGIAIIGANTTNGTWEFSLDNGSTWTSIGTVAANSARLLASDGATRIRFTTVKKKYVGTWDFTFVAWDQSAGTNGGTADPGPRGGSTAYSVSSDNGTVTIIKKAPKPPKASNTSGENHAAVTSTSLAETHAGKSTSRKETHSGSSHDVSTHSSRKKPSVKHVSPLAVTNGSSLFSLKKKGHGSAHTDLDAWFASAHSGKVLQLSTEEG
ncbi:MAG: LamG-like jellyroll fold domain-containing protein [Planctomycetales bacterium]